MPRTLAIGDIHGCLTALDTLLAAVQPASDDLVVTLGDYVDRGPDSRGVVERVLELGGRCRHVPLLGNHELMMLEAQKQDFHMWLAVGGRETLESYGSDGSSGWPEKIPAEHWNFMSERCLAWHETETTIFSHAGPNPLRMMEYQDEFDLFWQKSFPSRLHISGKTVVCGHVSQRSGVPHDRGFLVCIDTWAYGGGWLTCLDVDTGRYWQANQKGELREGRRGTEPE